MKKTFKMFFLSILILFSFVNANAEESGIKVSDKSNAGIAKAIATSDGNEGLKDAVKGFREIRSEISAAKKDPNATSRSKMCAANKSLMVSGSDVVKQISPIVYFIMTILILMAIKRFFIDNPEQQKNGYTSNVIGGSLYLFFAMLLSNFKSLNEWWDNKIIPEFAKLCGEGKDGALGIVIMENLLLFIFILVQFLGAIIIIMGLVDLIKKDRSGTVNLYGLGSKLFGGVLLVNYKWVLDFIGVIDM